MRPTGTLRILAAALFISLIPEHGAAQMILLPTVQLTIGTTNVSAEVAATEASRTNGLMQRASLPENHGMLFVFEQADQHCFWMKNTPLPLSIAFIDRAGIILNMADMQPFSEQVHCPTGPALYALEMEQGWFRTHAVQAGQYIANLPER